MKLPIFVALDVDSERQAIAFAERLKHRVEGFKIGPRLLLRGGAKFASEISNYGKLFIDFKFYDIPSTTTSAVSAAFELGASLCTIHASNSPRALREIGELAMQLSREREFRILGVTVLTSFDEQNRPTIWQRDPLTSLVRRCAEDAKKAELGGLVCSPLEIEMVKSIWPSAYVVTPGIRLEGEAKGDQSRTATPVAALQAGASALVMGRSLLTSSDPTRELDIIAKALLKK